jgi:Pyruvate/2-oxoacid:ferredoxin oxidoreductase delta subunit
MKGRHEVWTLDEVRAAIPKQGKYWISNCGCREEKGSKCRKGLRTCLGFSPESTSTKNGLREVGRREVDELLALAERVGLVPRPWVGDDGRVKASCFCCDCCCSYITSGKDNIPGKMVQKTSRDCVDCGACVEACCFGARAMKSGKLAANRSKCMGCGVCMGSCPLGAISMVPR